MNEAVLVAVRSAIEACVDAADDCENCKRQANPGWQRAAQALDDATDELRDLEAALRQELVA